MPRLQPATPELFLETDRNLPPLASVGCPYLEPAPDLGCGFTMFAVANRVVPLEQLLQDSRMGLQL